MKPRPPSGPAALSGPRHGESRATTSTTIQEALQDAGEDHMTGMLLTESEVAGRLRVSLACLRRWRLERRGPRFLKVGSLVRYPAEELKHWIGSLPAGGTLATSAPTGRNVRGAATA
jgi:predicted DNA-binding transcriptional regulator AlpA